MKEILLISKDHTAKGSIKLVKMASKNLGAKVIGVAGTYEEAITQIKKLSPSLIICDVDIEQDFDGIEIMHKITKKHIIPVILIATSTDSQILQQAQGIDIIGFIVKPFVVEQLEITMEVSLNT